LAAGKVQDEDILWVVSELTSGARMENVQDLAEEGLTARSCKRLERAFVHGDENRDALVAGTTDHVENAPVRHRTDIPHEEQGVTFEYTRHPRRTTDVDTRSAAKAVKGGLREM
jgi:hypothetical protein